MAYDMNNILSQNKSIKKVMNYIFSLLSISFIMIISMHLKNERYFEGE